MALPETGPITMQMVADHLGRVPGSQISLNDDDVRELARVNDKNTEITLEDLRGKEFTDRIDFIPTRDFISDIANTLEQRWYSDVSRWGPGSQDSIAYPPYDEKGGALTSETDGFRKGSLISIYDGQAVQSGIVIVFQEFIVDGLVTPFDIDRINFLDSGGGVRDSWNVSNFEFRSEPFDKKDGGDFIYNPDNLISNTVSRFKKREQISGTESFAIKRDEENRIEVIWK